MPDEDQLSLRQADQIRGDLYGIQDDLDFIKLQSHICRGEMLCWPVRASGLAGITMARTAEGRPE
jgi:hypothetical protein